MFAPEDPLTNGQIAELLAIAGDDAKPPLNRAYRRASRKALLWEEEAACLYQEGRSRNCQVSGHILRESSADGLRFQQS
jgi:phage terminase large subunit-like protein